ncbi:putative outer membrane protein pmp15 [Chlamydia avium]|nr:putative outer membrane protein pmp15 [Chlamydia avium]
MCSYACSLVLLIGCLTTFYPHNILANDYASSESFDIENLEDSYFSYLSSKTLGKLNDTSVDFEISNNDYFYIRGQFSQSEDKGGGGIAVNNLSIINNPGPVIFQANHTIGNGGAIYCLNNCVISNNQQLCCFMENIAGSSGTYKNAGAIRAINIDISNNQGPIHFLNNIATDEGGALYARENVTISNNYGEITFQNNKCNWSNHQSNKYGKGGSIEALKTVTITQNHAPITFKNNQGGNNGCICAETLIISDNDELITFSNNYCVSNRETGAGGGAIYCIDSCNIINNRKTITFTNNIAIKLGGGIFSNNNSQQGGALINTQGQNNAAAEFYLSADYGDIIFNRNFTSTTDKYYRNAISTAANLNLKVGSRKGYRVAFYDPIENTTSSTSVTINPETYHLGTVLFSGADVPNASQQEADYTSYLQNTNKISYGTLAVEDRACLALYSLTQDEGFLRLGNQGVITTTKQSGTTSTSGCSLTITKLSLNLPSLLKEDAQAPKIWIYPQVSNNNYSEDTNPTITISGDLTLVNDENENPYEYVDLSNSITKVPFLYLCDNATKKITIDNLNIEAINDTQHYGYQGIWSPYWEEYTTTAGTSLDTANTSHRMLYADWTATQYYIPNPKYNTPLVANSLWGNLYTTKSQLPPPPPDEESSFFISGYGLGTNIHQSTRNHIHGFHMISGGYAVVPASTTISNQKLAFIFSQQFTHIKEKVTHNKISSKSYLAGMQIQLPWMHKKLITTGSLAYNYGDHKLSSHYENNKSSQGTFYTHSFLATLETTLIFLMRKNYSLAAFLEALAFASETSQCKEIGDYPRIFSTESPLHTLALPIGIFIQIKQDSFAAPSLWKCYLSYQPLVYRQYPKILTTLIASNGSWLSQGSPVARNAFAANINNETQIFHNMKILCNYKGEISSSTFSNYLHIGTHITF